MSDLISRQAALDTLNGTITLKNSDDTIAVRDYIHQVESKLNNLPPAQPEITLESAIDYLHAIGWMQEHDRIMAESAHAHNESETGFLCSACGFGDFGQFNHGGKYASNYCPNCGAIMEERKCQI